MTRWVLDTNIISDATKPRPSELLVRWLGAQRDSDLHIASLTLAEIWRGIIEKPPGRKRRELEIWFSGSDGPEALFAGRVLSFDAKAAPLWARLMAEGKARGRPRNALDMIIAAVAEANSCVLVTANERDFAGVKTFNPLREAG